MKRQSCWLLAAALAGRAAGRVVVGGEVLEKNGWRALEGRVAILANSASVLPGTLEHVVDRVGTKKWAAATPRLRRGWIAR